MILRRVALLIVTASLVAVPAFAEEKSSAPKDDDVVCTYDKVMGSHISKRVCMTRAEHEALRQQAAEAMRERGRNRRSSSINPPPTG